MDKKNINIVAISMGSGGTEKTLYLILPLLIKNFNVNLILFNDVRHFAIPKEVNVYLLSKKKKDSFLNKVLSPFKFFFTYKKILNRTKPDISISFLTRPNLLNTFINSCNTRIIISERCFPSIAYKSNSIRYWLYKILLPKYYNKADLLFSNSIYINNDLKQNFGVTIPMKVIYNPIKVNNNDEINSFNSKNIDIIWIGKLYQIKNPNLLVKAVKICKSKPKVTVLGDGVLLPEIKDLATKLNFSFEGNVSNVFEYIKRSKVLLLTSNSEGFPNVILEGMSYGLPIIATNCNSGPLEILNDNYSVDIISGEYYVAKYGILVNVNDDLALSKAIDYLLSNQQLYNKLSLASRNRSQDYDVEIIYEKYKNMLLN